MAFKFYCDRKHNKQYKTMVFGNNMEQKSAKEEKIRAITKMYYSNPKIQEVLFKFAKGREVVPRYFEGFGKRPDSLQYPSDIMGLVNKGATSFHASEELWKDPLRINSEMDGEELAEERDSWDLLIDVDSPFLDYSKIATKLLIASLEYHGIKNYGVKFSGNKGFHIIVSGKAFPEKFEEQETKKMFPEWARAISLYLMDWIRRDYDKEVSKILTNFEALEKRTNLSKEDLMKRRCTNCNTPAQKGKIVKFRCDRCGNEVERKNIKINKRKLKCFDTSCSGELEIIEEREYYYCENCKTKEGRNVDSENNPEYFEKHETASAQKIASLDLVLVAPRHLFRMPYSLHEKSALASIVLDKEQIDGFSPRDANPFNVKIIEYVKEPERGEATQLLSSAIEWSRGSKEKEEVLLKKKYAYDKNYENLDFSNVTEEMFPAPIKKLLKEGLEDGKKRGLFILLTFLKSLNFPSEYINNKIREWNKLNKPPLKEGYIRSQIDWHLRQKKRIMPPNYDNESFYKDLKLIDKKQDAKNPLSEVMRKMRKKDY